MNTILIQDKQLTRNLWILMGICLLTAIITILGGFFSAKKFMILIDDYIKENSDKWDGTGLISLLVSGTIHLYQYFIMAVMVYVPIYEFIISFLFLIISLLFQIGLYKKWKIIVSNVLVGVVGFVKELFIVYLLVLIYVLYNLSPLLIVIFTLQIIVSLVLIIFSIKLIYIPSYKKENWQINSYVNRSAMDESV